MRDIPGFRLLERLPTHGPGEMWKAMRESSQRMVLLHLVSMEAAEAGRERERFMRQAGLCAQLSHGGLLTFLAQGVTNDSLWFATEWINGPDLEHYVRQRGPLSEKDAGAILWQMLDLLAYLHAREVVHRSLRPEGFLVRRQSGAFSLRLIDLGSAKCFLTDDLQTITQTGERGYPIHAFLAPETLLDARRQDARSDLYAAGAILYFVLTGRAPYVETTGRDLAALILETEPPPLQALRPEVAPALATIVQRAMQRDPDRRFPSAEAMRRTVAPVAGFDTGRDQDRTIVIDQLKRVLDGQADLQRRLTAIHGHLKREQFQMMEELLAMVRSLRINEAESDRELRAIVDGLRRTILHLQARRLPEADDRLRPLLDDLAQAFKVDTDVQTGLELTIPIIPLLLDFKASVDLSGDMDLRQAWDELAARLKAQRR